MELISKITEFAEDAIEDPQYFVVEVMSESNGKIIKVLIDGDAGIPIAECSRLSRRISARIDEEIPDEVGAFTIEVSSPGVDRPLKLARQFTKHIGRSLSFTDSGGKKHEGKFVGMEEDMLKIEEAFKEKGKKKQLLLNEYKIEQINDPRVVVSFKR
ncbi:MAG: ribosome assembly cofactor RimP [Bacteroidetes bacterium]|nr:ribosome assembly cofactor RimP [Bacteroidota bacterium]